MGSSDDRFSEVRVRTADAALVAIALAAAVAATRADLSDRGLNGWSTAADVLVGVAFVAGALAERTCGRSRWWFAAVGVAWLAGSLWPGTGLSHRAILLVALATFPDGRFTGPLRWSLAGAAMFAMSSSTPRWLVATMFLGVAAARALRRPRSTFASVAAAAVGCLIGGWWALERFQPGTVQPIVSLRAYELLLAAIALGFPIAARATSATESWADRMVAGAEATGLAGLESVLRTIVRDPTLVIRTVSVRRLDDVPTVEPSERSALVVELDDATRIVVEHRRGSLDDPFVREGVATAIRLVGEHEQLEQRLIEHGREVERTRSDLLVARDLEQRRMADLIRSDVAPSIDAALMAVRSVSGLSGDGAAALEVAASELRDAGEEVEALVRGVAAMPLGDGRLVAAVEDLARRAPIDAMVTASPGWSSDEPNERVLYFVACELLTNVVKHAGATSVALRLEADDRGVHLSVADDGCGGADANAPGLHGLALRVAALGGQLRVDSPVGAGTRATANIPRQPTRVQGTMVQPVAMPPVSTS